MSMNINVEKILETFGEQKRIFQREAQFQFELAWEIQNQIDNNGEKAKVYLEFLSCTKNKPKTKRFYSDIVIIDENRNYIVIELKYKTKKAYFTNGNGEQITLFNHGASDEGRYDYLLDIHRIELLKNKCTNTIEYEYSEHLQTFEKGYAILLTNEKQYWERKKRDAEKINAVDKYFSIGDGDEIEHEIHWNATQQKNWMKSRKGFLLTGDYICNWKNYCTDSTYKNAKTFKEFKYLITEIK